MNSGSAAPGPKTSNGRRSFRAAAVVLVGLVHAAAFLALGVGQGVTPPAVPEPFVVDLIPPPPLPQPDPPPPPPEPEPAPDPGGGAPAQASRVYRAPTPPPPVPELPIAPPVPAPEPELTVGAAPRSDPEPGLGQGGIGEGQGSGVGDGDGPGRGSGPAFIRGATNGQILSQMPRELQRRRGPARSAVSCVIRRDTRLDACTIVSEQPAGLGYGAIAIRVAEAYFRFRPPSRGNGEVIEGQRVTINIDFPSR